MFFGHEQKVKFGHKLQKGNDRKVWDIMWAVQQLLNRGSGTFLFTILQESSPTKCIYIPRDNKPYSIIAKRTHNILTKCLGLPYYSCFSMSVIFVKVCFFTYIFLLCVTMATCQEVCNWILRILLNLQCLFTPFNSCGLGKTITSDSYGGVKSDEELYFQLLCKSIMQ